MALLNTIKEIGDYFRAIYEGVSSLIAGLKVTGKYFVKRGETVTQQYPENRETLTMLKNFKGELMMLHDENNQHSCTACSNCERKCPNGSIEIVSGRVQGEDGRTKRVLEKYIYHLDMCTFCGLCLQVDLGSSHRNSLSHELLECI